MNYQFKDMPDYFKDLLITFIEKSDWLAIVHVGKSH